MARPVGQSRTTLGEDFRLINNRQGGRRRGRGGGGRPPGGNPNPGNRQDNRQRGNAAQLLEKYKGLARDAQMAGDRVLTETYLQYADHYFRVLGESRARFEEQRRQRGDDYDEDEDQEVEGSGEGESDGGDSRDRYEERQPEPRYEERAERPDRNERPDRAARADRAERPDRGERPDRADRNGEQRSRRPRTPRGNGMEAEASGDDGDERIALDVLPPAISTSSEEAAEPPARAPRARRPRRTREDEDIAPAA
jgi:hypothetical protein